MKSCVPISCEYLQNVAGNQSRGTTSQTEALRLDAHACRKQELNSSRAVSINLVRLLPVGTISHSLLDNLRVELSKKSSCGM